MAISSVPCHILLIPAYRPSRKLADLLVALAATRAFSRIVIVDDGSGAGSRAIFERATGDPAVTVLCHQVNLGKGAALKTGISHILSAFPACDGVVTADADGQHTVEDILKVVEQLERSPVSLVLGCRTFQGDVPWRSRFGNRITKGLFRLLAGKWLTDTQTGLRGLPRTLLPRLLEIASARYEFELDMLLMAIRLRLEIMEVPIRTVYVDANRDSHFNPLLDSMRIYVVLTRFSVIAAMTAVLDNAIFVLALRSSGNIATSQLVARLAAMTFNYLAVRNVVFLSDRDHSWALPRYVCLVAASGLASYAMLITARQSLGMSIVYAKLLAEGLLFLPNFVIQRDIVFRKDERVPSDRTDWDRYYRSVPPTARLSRRYTTRRLVSVLRTFLPAPDGRRPEITELGGANSCFLDTLLTTLRPGRYRVVDTNEYGLSLLQGVDRGETVIEVSTANVLQLPPLEDSDLVFSVGLIEHFDEDGTRRAIRSHVWNVRRGGILLVTFPTPTWLYRLSRGVCEALGVWKFPDERPIRRQEVLDDVGKEVELLHEETLWPLVFTQHLMVFRRCAALPDQHPNS